MFHNEKSNGDVLILLILNGCTRNLFLLLKNKLDKA